MRNSPPRSPSAQEVWVPHGWLAHRARASVPVGVVALPVLLEEWAGETMPDCGGRPPPPPLPLPLLTSPSFNFRADRRFSPSSCSCSGSEGSAGGKGAGVREAQRCGQRARRRSGPGTAGSVAPPACNRQSARHTSHLTCTCRLTRPAPLLPPPLSPRLCTHLHNPLPGGCRAAGAWPSAPSRLLRRLLLRLPHRQPLQRARRAAGGHGCGPRGTPRRRSCGRVPVSALAARCLGGPPNANVARAAGGSVARGKALSAHSCSYQHHTSAIRRPELLLLLLLPGAFAEATLPPPPAPTPRAARAPLLPPPQKNGGRPSTHLKLLPTRGLAWMARCVARAMSACASGTAAAHSQ